ncbi:nuclear transport factor 2 family protein [Sinomicrobium oceani]|uniref:nuclear transport factor 2 family protein n=1 Tax=Sinomicrobium oceani TaxID=1150368 RepID=UPI00227B1432|nr:nuclear transport factor 2 family protein [Sinomicrobium oceani]
MNNKIILSEANKAVAQGDYETFLTYCTEDTRWVFVGDRIVEGKAALRQYMNEVYHEPPVFSVDTLIEDGDYVTATGEISLKDANGNEEHFDYCDNWRFENGKMAALKAFVIKK